MIGILNAKIQSHFMNTLAKIKVKRKKKCISFFFYFGNKINILKQHNKINQILQH